MTPGGWIIMLASVGSVTALFGWCIYKVLTTPDEVESVHGFEIETPDAPARAIRKQPGLD